MATAAALREPLATRPQTERSERLFESAGVTPNDEGLRTLEDVVRGAWEALVLDARAECPVCGGALEPAGCAGCGSELS